MKHKIPRVAARFPAFWLILTVYLLEFGVPGPGQCHLILRQLSMWVPAVLGKTNHIDSKYCFFPFAVGFRGEFDIPAIY